jgi:hypothetical protein
MAALLCTGCSTKVVEYKTDSSGHIHYVGTFTKDQVWEQEETSDIDDEVAGKHPWAGISTWREYWRWRYANIRRYHMPDWKSTEFKNADDMVRWIEQQRTAKGLPSYD